MCGIFCILVKGTNIGKDDASINNLIENKYKESINNTNRRGPNCQNSLSKQINSWNIYLASSILWLQGSNLVEQPIETESSIFLYNGDVFDSELLSFELRSKKGDTLPLLNVIETSDILIETLEKIHGPYAFIYIDKTSSKLYFARDVYGRRSLLISKDNDKFVLSSVLSRDVNIPTIELPALGIFCLDLNQCNSISLYPWRVQNQHFSEKLTELESFLSLEINLVSSRENDYHSFKNPTAEELILLENVEKLDPLSTFQYLLSKEVWRRNVDKLKLLLENAVKTRVNNQPNFCDMCIKEQKVCAHATIGILFSGGIDCAIITLIADKYIDKHRPIDLLNVAFEKNNSYNTPDRLTAKQTLEELQRLCPERRWKLLEINVTQAELCKEREERIADLIFPLRSILDESLGCALWFASRGKTENYTTPSRVLFVGMGADELFGGYTRHRAAYKRGEWAELSKELDKDWKNIAHRNLARDDRVVSDHGRQLRTPYLDENLVEFVRGLNAWEKCYPSEKIIQGLGDKLLLRSLAHQLGLTEAAILRKRALQFGSRIANKKENAHEISPRL